MAISPTAYATAAEYRTAFSATDDAWTSNGADSEILRALTVVSRHIDSRCNRFFGKQASATAQVYIARSSSPWLTVHDMSTTPTGIKIDTDEDGVYTDEDAVTGFEAWPLDAQYGAVVRPYYQIALPSWASVTSFAAGQRVQVTCAWGWPSVPEAIKEATIQLAGILRLQSPRATTRYAEDLGQVIGASREARDIVERLVVEYGLVAVPR